MKPFLGYLQSLARSRPGFERVAEGRHRACLLVAFVLAGCGLPPRWVEVGLAPTGSVLIEDGKCCLGAVAGQDVVIEVVFRASDPGLEMRVGSGSHVFDEGDLSRFPWEVFSPSRKFPYFAPINWTGFYVTVQFQDPYGRLSPIYTDDISVEGMPAGYPFSTP